MIMGKVPAALVRFVRKLRGHSQPILAEASDGLLYVVKFVNNPLGPNLLFNETVGTELYRLSQLPVPCSRPLIATSSFIDTNPASWIETPEGALRPQPGLCFGSKFLGGKDVQLFEMLPLSFHERVRNRDLFWLAWLVDICASHADHRQAIFQGQVDRKLDAVFIDHGGMFGGPKGEMRPPLETSRYLDRRLYAGVNSRHVRELARSAVEIDIDRLWLLVKTFPTEWVTDSALGRLSECLNVIACSRIVERLLDTLMDSHLQAEDFRRDELPHRRKPVKSVLRTGIQLAGVRGSIA